MIEEEEVAEEKEEGKDENEYVDAEGRGHGGSNPTSRLLVGARTDRPSPPPPVPPPPPPPPPRCNLLVTRFLVDH